MKRFIDKGYEKMDESMDLMDLVKGHIKHAKILKQATHQNHHDIEDDSFDLDESS